MALELDIRANDEMEKSAFAAAGALDAVAERELKVDAIGNKIARTYKAIAATVVDVAKHAKTSLGTKEQEKTQAKKVDAAAEKARKRELQEKKRIAAVQKAEQKKRLKEYEQIKGAARLVTVEAVAAARAALDFSRALIDAARSAVATRRQSKAMVDAFSSGAGASNLKILDTLAGKLGETVDGVREKFTEYRTAGLSGNQAAYLIKLRADLMAVGLSADVADESIRRVTGAANGFGNEAAMVQAQALAKAYGVVGDGARAAARAGATVESAQNKLINTGTKALNDLWGKIGPSIGLAANRLADFADKLLNSKEGKAAIEGIANAFKEVASAVNPKNLRALVDTMKEVAEEAKNVAKWIGVAFAESKQLYKLVPTPDEMEGSAKKIHEALPLSKEVEELWRWFSGDNSKNIKPQSFSMQDVGRGGAGSIVIENINVTGGDAQEIASAIRHELQRLLSAGSLSRMGVTDV